MKDFKVYQASGYLTKLVTDASDVRKAYEEISGSLVEFDTPISAPLESLIVDINSVQDLHGQDAPYPAGGGKNLWGDLKMAEDIHSAIPEYSTIDTTNKTVSIMAEGAITRVVLFSGIFKENTRYTFIASGTFDSADRFNLKFVYTDDTTSVTFVNGANVSDAGKTVSAVIAWQYTGTSYLKYEECGLFEGNVSASDFAPYSNICPITGWTGVNIYHSGEDTSDPTTYTVSWQDEAGTVYGGTVDLVSGVLTVDRAEISVSEKPWSYYRGGLYTSVQGGTNVSPISDKYKTAERVDGMGNVENWEDYTIRASTDGAYIYIKDTRYESANEFTTAEGDTAICFELATPTEIQLTPQEINTLIGVNNIWADTGDVSVKYRTH